MNASTHSVSFITLMLGLALLVGRAYAQPTLYWSDPYAGMIQRMDVGSGTIDTLLAATLQFPHELAVDLNAGKMYWISKGKDQVQRANLDGTDIEDLPLDVRGIIGLALDSDGGKLYWWNAPSGISRANLDGTEIEVLIEEPSDFGFVSGGHLVLDEEKMYWQNGGQFTSERTIGLSSNARIRRANLDGSDLEDLIIGPPTRPGGLALAGDKLYWINQSLGSIHRADRDGTHEEALITSPVMAPEYLALDMEKGKLYWTEPSSNRVRRANLDGSEVETLGRIDK